MNPIDSMTDFASVRLPARENVMSRRYLQLMMRWISVGSSWFGGWPDRPRCGHFFGGVLWYGQETAMPIMALAAAASSPEFDPQIAGCSADHLREVAFKGLRYLCFTHDTGPADCLRPKTSWGRPEPAGTKWGERGRGFFPESQCGRTICYLTITASLLREMLGSEERQMLANIAEDYMRRFEAMPPRSGVYYDTQMEENAWTAMGMTACLTLLPHHERAAVWTEHAKRWMFCAATKPSDMFDQSVFADGKTVRELCGQIFTTLPDGTAENHGFVHPTYMASGISLSADAILLLKLHSLPVPPHLLFRRKEIYSLLKRWCDENGAFHCPQGMDWPYFRHTNDAWDHASARLFLNDPDGGLLEEAALGVLERSLQAHSGRLVPEEAVTYCHSIQDPAIMGERFICWIAFAYLSHRIEGPAQPTPEPREFQHRTEAVCVYPHGGIVLHRHARGINSIAWRNGTMVLPAPREGLRLIAPSTGSMLAKIDVENKSAGTQLLTLKIREAADKAAVLLVETLAQNSVRREVFFASLPDGRCLIAERLVAMERIRVQRVEQGRLNIINDGCFGDHPDLRGRRRVFWEGGEQTFEGYAATAGTADTTVVLPPTRWVNVDNRCGLVFAGTGRSVYVNRHCFQPWRAVEDTLILSLQDAVGEYEPGQEIARLASLWCPEEDQRRTATRSLVIQTWQPPVFVAAIDGFLCACNFGLTKAVLPGSLQLPGHAEFPISWGVSGRAECALTINLALDPLEPAIVASPLIKAGREFSD